MTTKILSIGLGGVGVIVSYGLEKFNENVEITAVIRSDYDTVMSKGYTISSCDYGGRSPNGESEVESENIHGYKPSHVVKTLQEASERGPFDFIVVSTKVIPTNDNVWDHIISLQKSLLKPTSNRDDQTAIVLIQNGIDIEKYWAPVRDHVTLISGVTYISSTNVKGKISQYNHDTNQFGLFDPSQGSQKLLEQFISLYENKHNTTKLDSNTRLTRWKKLLWNASFNTVCCLTDLDVGHVFLSKGNINVIKPIMKEIKYVANFDLNGYPEARDDTHVHITDKDIDTTLKGTEDFDAATFYQPSMLVDYRQGRQIELEVILGNIVNTYAANGGDKTKIPQLNLLYGLLSMVSYRIDESRKK
ncbi:hypothetical protein CAAN1_15S03158 [[Candida] anglica]|uniref:2-dehydropantoate 2-reductase n=1 Tax=[Candida] anglica TaxID=148631 RepID=A0ABP0ECN3_9ASCO